MNIIEELSQWEKLFFDNTDYFIKEIIGEDVIDVYDVSWNSNSMKYVYIQECGQHVSSDISMTKWLKLKDKYDSSNSSSSRHK